MRKKDETNTKDAYLHMCKPLTMMENTLNIIKKMYHKKNDM